jgi:hypothetical protein
VLEIYIEVFICALLSVQQLWNTSIFSKSSDGFGMLFSIVMLLLFYLTPLILINLIGKKLEMFDDYLDTIQYDDMEQYEKFKKLDDAIRDYDKKYDACYEGLKIK